MTDELPEFDVDWKSSLPPKPEPKPARRKAPRRRKVKKAVVDRSAAIRVGKRAAKKRKVAKKARRGRPPGSPNKPKVGERLIASVRETSNRIKAAMESPAPAIGPGPLSNAATAVVRAFNSLPTKDRLAALEHIKVIA